MAADLDLTAADPDAPLTPAQAAGHCGVTDDTIRHWLTRGIWINGRNVRLTARHSIGKRYRTSAREIEAFRIACQAAMNLPEAAATPTATAQRRKAADAKARAAALLG